MNRADCQGHSGKCANTLVPHWKCLTKSTLKCLKIANSSFKRSFPISQRVDPRKSDLGGGGLVESFKNVQPNKECITAILTRSRIYKGINLNISCMLRLFIKT